MTAASRWPMALRRLVSDLQPAPSETRVPAPVQAVTTARIERDAVPGCAVMRRIMDLICELHRSPTLAQTIAAHSYVHTNGFAKLRLSECLAIHVWPDSDVQGRWIGNVHNHRRPFTSSVLVGSLEMEHYALGNTGMPVYHHRYVPTGSAHEKTYDLRYTHRARLLYLGSDTVSDGDSYGVSTSLLHRVRSSPTTAISPVTVLRYGGQSASSTSVYSFDAGGPRARPIRAMGLTQLAAILKTLSDRASCSSAF